MNGDGVSAEWTKVPLCNNTRPNPCTVARRFFFRSEILFPDTEILLGRSAHGRMSTEAS